MSTDGWTRDPAAPERLLRGSRFGLRSRLGSGPRLGSGSRFGLRSRLGWGPRWQPRWRLGPRRTIALLLAVLAAVAALGWVWYRSSSLVAVRQVTVTGLSGPEVPQIRDALAGAARSMTTLELSVAKLEAAVSAYPEVGSLRVSSRYPHGVTITVDEQIPLAEIVAGGRTLLVDGAGRLLTSSRVPHGSLPELSPRSAPNGDWLTAAGARAALRVLQAAPYRLLGHVQSAESSAAHGVVVQLRRGPALYFGGPGQLSAKWTAAIAVLANADAKGAQYIDVSDPRRPAAGAS